MTNTGLPLAPTHPLQRIQSLDILRGMALLGMFIVHFHLYSTDPGGGIGEAIRVFVWRLIEGKSHGTFAILFGCGFAIQLRRAEDQQRSFVSLYLRRLAILAAFGFAAHAFFGFNVLLGYAVWALPLLVIRTWSTRTLLLLAVLSAASVRLWHLGETSYLSFTGGPEAVAAAAEAQQALSKAVNDGWDAALAQTDYTVLLVARLRHMAWFYTQPFFFMPSVTLTLFITGLLLVRHRVIDHPRAHQKAIIVLSAFGLVSWISANWLENISFGLLRDQWLTFAYFGSGLLLLAYKPVLLNRLRAVGKAGQMALTNYLLQIVVLDLLFPGYALGLQKVRPVVGLAAALTLFAAEVAFSVIWLRHFRFGPVEWLWRSLTYGRPQPMLRTTPAAVAA